MHWIIALLVRLFLTNPWQSRKKGLLVEGAIAGSYTYGVVAYLVTIKSPVGK
jgi:hypothetical protein